MPARIIALCVLSALAFGYSWWNEQTRQRPSVGQKRLAQALLITGLVGSLSLAFWGFSDAARDATQRDTALSAAQGLAIRAAEHSNVAVLTDSQQRAITAALQGDTGLRVELTCLPGATEFCRPLIRALQAAGVALTPTLNYVNLGGALDAGPSSYSHQVTIIAMPTASKAGDALAAALSADGIDAGAPPASEWNSTAQAAYAHAIDPYPLRIMAIP